MLVFLTFLSILCNDIFEQDCKHFVTDLSQGEKTHSQPLIKLFKNLNDYIGLSGQEGEQMYLV